MVVIYMGFRVVIFGGDGGFRVGFGGDGGFRVGFGGDGGVRDIPKICGRV